jgi:D-serine deaminase-like pyridoxal phosphate-dependent protein
MQLAAANFGLSENTMTIFDLDTPALLVDLDILERNLAAMAGLVKAGGKLLRPHTKTHKTPEIARMQIAAGARGLTVAKLGEAEVLADAGLDDLFIGNQIVGPIKIERLLKLMERVRITVGIDSIEAAQPIAEAASRRGLRAQARIEIDTGLGRAGTRSDAEVLAIARYIAGHPGLELDGIFTHEGHLYKSADAADTAALAAAMMRRVADMLRAAGMPCPEVSVGSTPGASLMAHEPGLTELRPGVYVFNDRTQLRLGVPRENCALTVLATVTSVRPDGRIILDAGTKSLASDCNFEDRTFGDVLGHPELRFVGASEEHGHLQADGMARPRVGDKVRIIPNHACTCVNMHDRLTAFRGESVEATWTIAARGRIR